MARTNAATCCVAQFSPDDLVNIRKKIRKKIRETRTTSGNIHNVQNSVCCISSVSIGFCNVKKTNCDDANYSVNVPQVEVNNNGPIDQNSAQYFSDIDSSSFPELLADDDLKAMINCGTSSS